MIISYAHKETVFFTKTAIELRLKSSELSLLISLAGDKATLKPKKIKLNV